MSVRVGESIISSTHGGGPDGRSRWGDHFDGTVDSVDDRPFSMVCQRQDADGWTTEIHRFTIGLAALGDAGGSADLNRDGLVDGGDAGLMLWDWTD